MHKAPTLASVDAFTSRTESPERIKRRMRNLSIRLSGLAELAAHRSLCVTSAHVADHTGSNLHNWTVSDVILSRKGVPYIAIGMWPNRLTSSLGRCSDFRPPIVIPQETASVCYMARRRFFRVFRPFPSWGFKQSKTDLATAEDVIQYFTYALGSSKGYGSY